MHGSVERTTVGALTARLCKKENPKTQQITGSERTKERIGDGDRSLNRTQNWNGEVDDFGDTRQPSTQVCIHPPLGHYAGVHSPNREGRSAEK